MSTTIPGIRSGHGSQTGATASSSRAWIGPVARAGYAAKGLVYLIVGGLGLGAAFFSTRVEGSEGALEILVAQPFGRLLIAAVALGLLAYVIWRSAQSLLDVEDKGTDPKGILVRTFYMLSALTYTGLLFFAVRLALGGGSGGSESASDAGAETLLSYTWGAWLLGLIGLGVVAIGLYQFMRAYKASFRDHLDLDELSRRTCRWIVRFGRFGLAARGVALLIVGGFVVVAAVEANAEKIKSTAGALRFLEQQAYGPWLLAAVALGLIAYAVHQFVKARYRRIEA